MASGDHFFEKVGRFLARYWFDLSIFFIPGAYGLCQWLMSDEVVQRVIPTEYQNRFQQVAFWVVIPLFIAHCVLVLVHMSRSRSVHQMEEENERLKETVEGFNEDVQMLAEGYLYGLAKHKLAFGTGNHSTERLTLYVHDGTENFWGLGRYSPHPDWGKFRRREYSAKEGCIGRTWRDGAHFADDYPESEKTRGEGVTKQYIDRCARENLGEEAVRQIRMKSRFFYGRAVQSTSGMRVLAVVLLESTAASRYNREELDDIFDQREMAFLSSFVERIQPRLPDIRTAAEKGL